ncbi:protein of unknown function [Nitrospira japonica]|uniref:Uncharacterized protein n=1 Tax=Nitrospira japonica TaxID=1325564 RepID=A0A1W1I198_9BACT|nr:hypothetical protein [Nitrospira japonica]SLM46775.1 protein of unknown function [Nitrospira japonica]
MASRYRKIDPRIWTDEKFRRLTAEEQRIALYILTAQSNRIGLFSFSPGKASEDLETLPPTFLERFGNVCRTLNWEWDADARVLFLPTWWRYNQPENANNVIGNLKDLDDLPETPLLKRFSANTAYLPEGLIGTFTQTLAKRYPQRYPKRSPSQEQEQEQEQKQEPPPAEHQAFGEFWNLYPTRNGKKLGRTDALKKFCRLTPTDQTLLLTAVKNYASSGDVVQGVGIADPHRWIQKGTGKTQVEPWRDWIEPAPSAIANGHSHLGVCTKRIHHPGSQVLRACGEPASPVSRPDEPRCQAHLSSVIDAHEVMHA